MRSRNLAPLALVATAACSGGATGEPAGTISSPVAVAARAASPPATEVDLVEVPAQPTGARYRARMFYAFEPADDAPETKPLAVLFNGGPGGATTAGLFPYGTGRLTLDPRHPGVPPQTNPARWTRFANLLYVDARQAGFSYGLLPAGGRVPADCVASSFEEAADFVRVLLAFFDAHPAIEKNPVVLVGESYGGLRVTAMLDMLLRYRTSAEKGAPDLANAIDAHYRKVFPDVRGDVPEDVAARQFGHAVLLEPAVGGALQVQAESELQASDPWLASMLALDDAAYAAIVPDFTASMLAAWSDPSASTALLGRDPTGIGALLPAARTNAFRVPNELLDVSAVNAGFAARLGALARNDAYFTVISPACSSSRDPDPTRGVFGELVANLRSVHTFLSNARYDRAVWSPAIPRMLAENVAGLNVVVDDAPRAGVARPGLIHLTPASGAPLLDVRYPTYAASGHMIETSEPEALADDVGAWLAESVADLR